MTDDGVWYLKNREWVLIKGQDSTKILPLRWCNWRSSSPRDITGGSPHSGSASRHYEIPEWKRSTCPDERCAFVSESFPLGSLPLFLRVAGAELLCSSSAKWLSVSSEFPDDARTRSMAYFLRRRYFDSFERKRNQATTPTLRQNDRSKRFFSTIQCSKWKSTPATWIIFKNFLGDY